MGLYSHQLICTRIFYDLNIIRSRATKIFPPEKLWRDCPSYGQNLPFHSFEKRVGINVFKTKLATCKICYPGNVTSPSICISDYKLTQCMHKVSTSYYTRRTKGNMKRTRT